MPAATLRLLLLEHPNGAIWLQSRSLQQPQHTMREQACQVSRRSRHTPKPEVDIAEHGLYR